MQTLPTVYGATVFPGAIEAKWAAFFRALGIPVEHDKQAYPLLQGEYSPHFWLPNEEVWVDIKPLTSDSDSVAAYKKLSDSSGFPLLCIKGEPRPGHYRIVLYSPRHNRRLYPRMTNAVFAEGNKRDGTLWLVQSSSYIRVCKLWHLAQLKAAKPFKDSDWLTAAFEYVRELKVPTAH